MIYHKQIINFINDKVKRINDKLMNLYVYIPLKLSFVFRKKHIAVTMVTTANIAIIIFITMIALFTILSLTFYS